MPKYNKARNLEWGKGKRTLSKAGAANSIIGFPNRNEGSNGDIQVGLTDTGGKLFAKLGGTWYSSALTSIIGDPVTRIGTNLSDHLAITKDSVNVFTENKKVASFGSTITFPSGNVGIGTSTFDGSVAGYLTIGNGTEPSAHTDNQIYIGSKDSTGLATDGATLALFVEGTVQNTPLDAVGTLSHRMSVWVNGTEYFLYLDPV